MKKTRIFVAIASLVFSSCSKEVEPEEPIVLEYQSFETPSEFEGVWHCEDFTNGNSSTIVIEDYDPQSIVLNGNYYGTINGSGFITQESNGFIFTGEIQGETIYFCQETEFGINCGNFIKL